MSCLEFRLIAFMTRNPYTRDMKILSLLTGMTLFGAAAFGTASAADLTLYYNFSEVRDPVQLSGNRFTWTPAADLAGFIVPGSLALEYDGVANLTVLPASQNLLAAFEGKEVLVKRDGQTIKAKVLRADLGLFEANGSYFQGDVSSVTFPSLDGVRFAPQYVWGITGNGGSSTLSYLTRGLSWGPRYSLVIEKDKADLNGWAEIRNLSGLEYRAPAVSLVAGQVNLETNYSPQENFQGAQLSRASSDSVQSTGEASGLQTFKYAQPVILPPRASTSVPFGNTKVSLDRTLEYVSGFNQSARIVTPLSRAYTLKADGDLPGGIVTVREDGRVVGQSRIGDTPKAEGAQLALGPDFDLRLTRSVQALERTKNSQKFRVTYSLTNTKTRSVNVRLKEILGNEFTLTAVVLPNLKRNEDGFTATANLNPGARLEASYNVSFRIQP
jgi:hypothetical protein